MGQTTLLSDILESFTEASRGDGEPEARQIIPEEILASAYAEAEEILATAREQSAASLAAATIEGEVIKESARRLGHAEGLASAKAEAEATARRETDAYKAALTADLQLIVDSIGEGRRLLWDQQEAEMLAFVLDISRQVIKTEVQQNQEVLMEILRNAMRRVTDKENLRVRVSVTDAPRVKAIRDDVMQIVDGVRSIEIVDDRRIAPGGCVIETNAGTIDAKIETQMAEIERAIGETAEL